VAGDREIVVDLVRTGIGIRFSEDHMKVIRGVLYKLVKTRKSAVTHAKGFTDDGEGHVSGGEASDNENADLDHIGEADDLHPAEGNEYGKDGEGDDDDMELVIGPADEAIDGDGAEVEDGGQVDEYIEEEPEDRHDKRDGFVVTRLQELGHGEYLVLQV